MEDENMLDIIFSVQSQTAVQALNTVKANFESYMKLFEKYQGTITGMAKPVNTMTIALERLSQVNMRAFGGNLNIMLNNLSAMGQRLGSLAFDKLRSELFITTDAFEKYNNAISKTSKLMRSEGVFDFSKLNNVNVAPLTALNEKLNDFKAESILASSNALNSMVNSMKKLETVNFADAKGETSGVDTKMDTLTSSLRTYVEMISKFNLNGLASFTKDIQQLPKMMKSMETINVATVTNNIDTLTTKLQKFIATLKEGSADISNFSTIIKSLGKGTNTAPLTNMVKQSTKSIKDMGNESDTTHKKLNNMLSFGKLYAFYNQVRHYGRGFLNILNKSIDFNEIENYFARAMGNMYNEAMKFQNKLSDMFGLAIPDMMKAQATFKNMLGAIGDLSDEMSYKLSERVTQMALDFSSLYNVSIEQSMTKFQAALSKQVRPIRSVSGYDITQNVLGATMAEIGINDRKITQMNELEKRLLVILTLQQQMAKSSAMNDFSRTLESPANQLRVLQQQLQETGRWISAVFYGTIAHVLPYINGFVMAIKEIIRALALFVGYELPNSSGQTGGIFDGIEDSVGGVSDGLEDVNSGLDSANDKAKKFKTYLMGFDVAQVIPDQSDSDKDGSSGTGGMTVDPKILDALNKYKYLFDDIQMKATDIRDKLLGWKDAIGSAIKENIFEPMWNSWQKYGSSITKNISDAGSNIGHIFSGIFDVIGEKWKPFFQNASDLFFSLLDTTSLVADTITSLLARIWDHGGETLFEGIADLATAFLKLATSVNDNFIKPVIKGFNSSLGPVIADFVGIALSLIGNLLKGLGKIIDWIADCEPLVIGLATAFTTMFLAINAAKLANLFSKMQGGHKAFKILIELMYDHNTVFKKVIDQWINGETSVSKLKTTWELANKFLSNTKVWDVLSTCLLNASVGLDKFSTWAGKSIPIVGDLASKISTGLSAALTWLAANPMVAVVAAIGLVVGAFAVLGQNANDTAVDIEDCSDEVQEQAKRVSELAESMDQARTSFKDSLNNATANTETLKQSIEQLKDLGGKTGVIDESNLQTANKLIEEINDQLGDTVEISEDGRLVWKKNNEDLNEAVELVQKRAEAEAVYQYRVELNRKILEGNNQLVELGLQLEEKRAKLAEKESNPWWNQTRGDRKEIKQLKTDIEGLEQETDKARKTVEEAQNSISSLDKNSQKASSSIEDLTTAQAEFYGTLGLSDEKAIIMENAFSDMVDSIKNLGNATDEEKDSYKQNADEMIAKFVEKAKKLNLSYDDMVEILKERGIELTDEEKEQLEKSLANQNSAYEENEKNFKKSKDEILKTLKASNKDFTKAQEEEYSTLLESLKKHGGKISTEYTSQYQSMLRTLKENNVDLNTEQGEAYSRMFTLLQEYGFDFNDEQTRQFAKGLELAIASGDEQGKQFIGNLKTSISKDSIEPEARSQWWKAQSVFVDPITGRVTITNTTDVANGARSELTGKLSNLPSSVQRAVGNVWSAVDYVAQYFGNSPLTVYLSNYLGNKYGAWSDFQSYMSRNPFQATVDIASGSFKWMLSIMGGRGYATGGFPSMGEMFIAREAGPEFVGTMGGRTAVANNYQIENGIYRAVKSAMQGTGNSKQTIHLTFNLPDGTKIEKVIEDYNDYINRNGGKGGFDI